MMAPDVDAVLRQLQAFQRDTVEYAFQRLYLDADSTHRFLVADEVGLGKTLVARGVIAKAIAHLWDQVDRIDIIYICSNGDIARQNVNRLNPTNRKEFALASRITLLPLALRDLQSQRFNFIAFTPGTSFQLAGGGGVWRERVLLYWLLHDAWGIQGAGPKNVLQGGVMDAERFRDELTAFGRSGAGGGRPYDPTVAESFARALEQTVQQDRAAGRTDLRARFSDLSERFGRSRIHVPPEDRRDRDALIGDFRKLLAKTCLGLLQPDLVILDEFQRFRDLLDGEDAAAELARDLFGFQDDSARARVLLLSATPYKMYTLAHESAEDDHYRDFLRTVRFLTQHSTSEDGFPALLARYRRELYALGDAGGSEIERVKTELEASLRRVMARTERVGATAAGDGMLREVLPDGVRLSETDVRSFISLQRVAEALGQPDVVEYWKSAPYLLNFMDAYKLKEALVDRTQDGEGGEAIAHLLSASPALLLDWSDVEHYRTIDPGNARLRSFMADMLGNDAWRLLWVPPTAPYYALEEPFASCARAGYTKRLVFSAWMVVPRVIATLVSYEAERRIFTRYEDSPQNTSEARERRSTLLSLTVSEGRLTGMPVLGILYPSPTLVKLGDPLSLRGELGTGASLSEVLNAIERRLAPLVAKWTSAATTTGTEDEGWYWATPILLDLKRERESTHAWLDQADLPKRWSGVADPTEEASLRWAEHVERAAALASGQHGLGRPPKDLLRVLALAALAAPGTAALRSLARVSRGTAPATDLRVRNAAARIAWGFRSLFNQPEAMAILRAGHGEVPYWQRVLEYGAGGCLPALLDEYLHLVRDFEGLFDAAGADLAERIADAVTPVLSLRTSTLRLDEIQAANGRLARRERRMRARFAMRFGKEKSETETEGIREDLVRTAFNSPFWPFALATTSVGQEGLDFHPYCHAVVHWNLPANPVDLEQREGRVHRYKGHAIRKNVAARFAQQALEVADGDPWQRMFTLAAAGGGSRDRGLSPYWVYPIEDGAVVERHVPALPLSRDRMHLEALRRSLAVYRMVFGQPRQDDLLAYLLEHVDPVALKRSREMLRINLAPPNTESR